MRVIGGIHRSRILEEVPSDHTRETKDRVKEALFNSIQPVLYDANVLDLFCGSGSLGIEALSRGARQATFNDQDGLAIQVTTSNLTTLKLLEQATIHQMEALTFLSQTRDTFDVILLDPPYSLPILEEAIQMVADNGLLHEYGVLVCLHHKNNTIALPDCGIMEYKTKTYGVTKLTYFKRSENA